MHEVDSASFLAEQEAPVARRSIPSYFYVLVVVPYGGRYLLIQERKHAQTWYLPSGGVEPGETILEAAIRETWEEAGIEVRPQGILGFDHQWIPLGGQLASKWRYMILAHPAGSTSPKRRPDRHALGARWVWPEEIGALPLRAREVVTLIDAFQRGGLVMPLSAYSPVPPFALAD